ncbi:hypothetical protein OSTOST_05793, partial [Ostertagia ostertagi]
SNSYISNYISHSKQLNRAFCDSFIALFWTHPKLKLFKTFISDGVKSIQVGPNTFLTSGIECNFHYNTCGGKVHPLYTYRLHNGHMYLLFLFFLLINLSYPSSVLVIMTLSLGSLYTFFSSFVGNSIISPLNISKSALKKNGTLPLQNRNFAANIRENRSESQQIERLSILER